MKTLQAGGVEAIIIDDVNVVAGTEGAGWKFHLIT